MTDLERLDEALGWSHQVVAALRGEWRPEDSLSMIGAILRLQDAARAYRDILANGQRVEWCDVHESKLADQGLCQWVAWGKDITAVKPYDPMACSIVSRLLVDPPKEEE